MASGFCQMSRITWPVQRVLVPQMQSAARHALTASICAGVRLFRALQAMLPGSAGAQLAPAQDPAAGGGALGEGAPGSGSALGAEVPMELAAAAAPGAAPEPETDPSPDPAPRERAPPRRGTRGRAPRGPPAGAP